MVKKKKRKLKKIKIPGFSPTQSQPDNTWVNARLD